MLSSTFQLSTDRPLHLLMNNAGTFTLKFTTIGASELKLHFHVNHVSHFLLTHLLLLPRIRSSGGGRVINVSSRAHLRSKATLDFDLFTLAGKDRFDPGIAYGLSKLCNILFTKSLAYRFPVSTTGISFYSLTPGLVDTKILDPIPQFRSSAVSVAEGDQDSHACRDNTKRKTLGSFCQLFCRLHADYR